MAVRSKTLTIENLESRLNLSSLGGLSIPMIAEVRARSQEHAVVNHRSNVISLTDFLNQSSLSGSKPGDSGNPHSTNNTTNTTNNFNPAVNGSPTGLIATTGTSSINLRWTDNSSNETGYRIYRSTDGVNFSVIGTANTRHDTYSDSTAAAGVTYYYKVTAYNSVSESAATNTVSAALPPPVTAPIAPGSFTSTAVSATSVSLSWSDNSTNESGYHIYRSTDGTNFTLVGSLAANSTTFTDSSLSNGTTYFYKVSAWNSGGETYASNVVSAATTTPAPPPITAPIAPGSFTSTGVNDTSVSLSWMDNSTNESGYHVYRSTDGTNFTLVGSLAANSTTFTDSSLSNGTTYYYKVSAWNSGGETFASNVVSAATTTPVAPPAPPTSTPVTIFTRNMVGFTELDIDGTSGNDSIMVTQSGGVLTITANGQTSTYANTFGDMVIQGYAGDDTITVDSSVNIPTLVYGGDGNNVIKNQTTAKATIVTIGNGVNTVTGNGINTAFWVNPNDTVNATSAEIALGGVNRVNNFYQPWSSDPTNPDYISRELLGQNLRDPSDAGTETRLTNNSFFGLGPSMNDINQTSLADCYFLAPLSSFAYSEPQRLMDSAVDLGDGTYAFKFVRNGVTSFVRVDGDLSVGGWSWGLANQTPGVDGNLWASLYEKAYAFFRTGANTYASLNYGFQYSAMNDLGLTAANLGAGSGATAVLNLVNTQLAAGHAIAANTNGTIVNGAPLIDSHVYSIIGAFVDPTTNTVMIQLRNPWGVDGAGNDGVDDGIVTISYSLFASNFGNITYSLV